jgi:hypothetical protein
MLANPRGKTRAIVFCRDYQEMPGIWARARRRRPMVAEIRRLVPKIPHFGLSVARNLPRALHSALAEQLRAVSRARTRRLAMRRRHREATAFIAGSPESVFAFIDDHSRFSSHMSQSSWMMGGGGMRVDLDEQQGRVIGSHIRLVGSAFGLTLFLDEVVTRREPPTRKEWETVGTPRLLVIGSYAMGVEISGEGSGSRLRVFIDYELPGGLLTRWLGVCFAGLYARWCVGQMLTGVADRFVARGSVVAA